MPREDPRLGEWKRAWATAVLTLDAGSAGERRSRLDGFALPEDDIEIERGAQPRPGANRP